MPELGEGAAPELDRVLSPSVHCWLVSSRVVLDTCCTRSCNRYQVSRSVTSEWTNEETEVRGEMV